MLNGQSRDSFPFSVCVAQINEGFGEIPENASSRNLSTHNQMIARSMVEKVRMHSMKMNTP